MPRSNRNRRSKKMKGGLFGLFEGDSSSGNSSATGTSSGWFSGLTEKAKSATGSSSWFSSTPPPAEPTPTQSATPMPAESPPQTQSYAGGKRRRRRMRGGYSASSGNSSLANNAASYSGPTARANSHVGGTRKCCKKYKKSCKSHKKRCHYH